MNELNQTLTRQFDRMRNWAIEVKNHPNTGIVLQSSAQLATSWAIQKLAISIFALSGTCVVICTFTAVGIGAALFAYKDPIIAKACRVFAQFGVIQLVHEMCLSTFIHEMGHAMAGMALYRSRQFPSITLDLFGGGATKTVITHLSSLGNFFGKDGSKLIVAAAGPLASVAFAVGMVAWSTFQSDESSAERMMIHGGVQLMTEMRYAWESIWIRNPTSLSNDYIALHKLGGIHPGAALAMLALVPIIQLLWINRDKANQLLRNAW